MYTAVSCGRAALDEFIVGIWPADNDTMQLSLFPIAADHRFRPAKDPDVFTRVVSTVPAFRAWVEALLPAEIYTDPEVVASTRRVLATPGAVPPLVQPTRDELEAALGIG
jgi:hypothetical protein